jgi:hypothetical protein
MIKRSLSYLLSRVLEIYMAERVTDPAPILRFEFTMNGIIDVGISQKLLFLADGKWECWIYATEPLSNEEKVTLQNVCRWAATLLPIPRYRATWPSTTLDLSCSALKRLRSDDDVGPSSSLEEHTASSFSWTVSDSHVSKRRRIPATTKITRVLRQPTQFQQVTSRETKDETIRDPCTRIARI